MKKYDFIREKIKTVKEDLKASKLWRKSLIHEYGLERTWKNNQQEQVSKMIKISDVEIKHYQAIIKELEKMLKEMQNIEKE